jgi:ubiquitin-protein ligase
MSLRLAKEWKQMENTPDEDDRFFAEFRSKNISGENVWLCKILIPTEQKCAYRGAIITVQLTFPNEYPFKPPEVVFKTPILHPYINEGTGELCSCIMKLSWPGTTGHATVRFTLSIIYRILVSDGSNMDDQRICLQYAMKNDRNENYILFDSIVQRTLGLELPEDVAVDDREHFTYRDLGNWSQQKQKQLALNQIRETTLMELFNGKYEGMHTMVSRFMGIGSGTFAEKESIVRDYTYEGIEQPVETIRVQVDGPKTCTIPKWAGLDTIDVDQMDEECIPLYAGVIDGSLMSKESLMLILSLCKPEKETSLRMYLPTFVFRKESTEDPEADLCSFVQPFQMYDKQQMFELLKTADVLGAGIIVCAGCLHLAHLIKRESIETLKQLGATPSGNTKAHDNSYFKTFVSNI